MSEVVCPIDPCDFQGPPESVEAHISGSTTGSHEGLVGRELAVEPTGSSGSGRRSSEEGGALSNPVVLMGAAMAVVVIVWFLYQQSGEEAGAEEDEPTQTREVRR